MVKYKEKWESVKGELEDLKSRMVKQSLTAASIATYPDKIDYEEFDELFDKLRYDFYGETEIYTINFEWCGKGNSISIIGPEGVIGGAEDFFKERDWEIEQVDLIVLKRRLLK